MADIAGEFGGEAKIIRHDFGPALHSGGRGASVKSGIALNGVEDLGIEPEVIAGTCLNGIQVLAPGVFTPGRAADEIRQTHQIWISRPSTSISHSTKPAVVR